MICLRFWFATFATCKNRLSLQQPPPCQVSQDSPVPSKVATLTRTSTPLSGGIWTQTLDKHCSPPLNFLEHTIQFAIPVWTSRSPALKSRRPRSPWRISAQYREHTVQPSLTCSLITLDRKLSVGRIGSLARFEGIALQSVEADATRRTVLIRGLPRFTNKATIDHNLQI